MPEGKKSPIRRKRKKQKNGLGYILLFTVVFLFALWGLSYIVQSYSPDVDVEIGNNESLMLNETDTEIKTVDERLKWIKMEDELPTVSIKSSKEDDKKYDSTSSKKQESAEQNRMESFFKNKQEDDVVRKNIQQQNEETNKQRLDFRIKNIQNIPSVPSMPKETLISKVYVGKFSNVEEAIATQNKIAAHEPDTVPFIKLINGKYVVQIGSFSDKEKAVALAERMNSKGYSARVVTVK